MPPLVVRLPRSYWVTHLALAVVGALNGLYARWFLLLVPVWLFAAYTGRRMRTVAGEDGLTVDSGLRERRVPWPEVAGLGFGFKGAVALLRDGTSVRLPGVVRRAIVPEAYVDPRSAQAVALRARAAGHEVPVDGRTV